MGRAMQVVPPLGMAGPPLGMINVRGMPPMPMRPPMPINLGMPMSGV